MRKTIAVTLTLLLFISLFGCGSKSVKSFIRKKSDAIDELNEKYGDTMQYSMEEEDGNLVVNMRFLVLTESDEDSLSQLIQNSDETYMGLYILVRQFTGNEDIKVIMRYYDANGNLVVEKTIDSGYNPSEKAETTESLEGYVNSAQFQDMFKQGNSEEFTFESFVENGSTVVILYRFTEEVDRSTLDQSRAEWKENLKEEKLMQGYRDLRSMLQGLFPNEEIKLVLRFTDHTNETLYEQTVD